MPTRSPPLRRRAARLALTAAALVAVHAGWAQTPSNHPFGRTTVTQPDSAAGRTVKVVYQGTYDRVRIERAEPGTPAYRHPVTPLTVEQLRGALAALRRVDGAERELFNADELAVIVPPLVQALGELTPEQELSFAVTGRHGAMGPLVERSVTTGRLFRDADGLQLIVGLAHRRFEGEYLGSGVLISFEPGSRAAPVDRNLRIGAQGTDAQRRADWVALALGPAGTSAAAAPAVAPAMAAPAPARVATPAAAPAAAPARAAAAAPGAPAAPAAAAPAAPSTPTTPAAPAAAAPAPSAPPTPAAAPAVPRTRDAAFLAEQEERLKTLKRLRDQNLITEEEYQQKRREILQLL